MSTKQLSAADSSDLGSPFTLQARFLLLASMFLQVSKRIIMFLYRILMHGINQIQQEPDDENTELKSLANVAPADDRVFDQEEIFKLGKEGWQGRRLVLTKSDLFLAHPGDEYVAEKIPLHEILAVKRFDGTMDVGFEVPDSAEVFAFLIQTMDGGYTFGRDYCFRISTEELCNEWISMIDQLSKSSATIVGYQRKVEEWKLWARTLILSYTWQAVVSVIIAINFAINLAQSSAMPESGSGIAEFFFSLDVIFTAVFTVELMLNLFGNWFWPFFRDGWSVFDLIVVTVSIASLALPDLPGVSILRLLRTFRVLRLFSKLRSLRIIMSALAISMYPVSNALLLAGLVLFVYAILGVQLYRDLSPADFGSFADSVWTMFEVSTVDGWARVADAVSSTHPDRRGPDASPALFMGSFIVIVFWILQPLVMCVLLDNFVQAVKAERQKAAEKDEQARRQLAQQVRRAADRGSQENVHKGAAPVSQRAPSLEGPLSPLIVSLAKFRDAADLSRRIQDVFKVLDVDLGGTLSFTEMRDGLRRMNFEPPIDLSSDDFSELTERGLLCNADGGVDLGHFEAILTAQVERHVRERVADAFDRSPAQGAGSELGAILAGLKLLLVRGDDDAPAPASGGGGGGYRPGSNGGGGLARGGRQRPEVVEFLSACRRMGAWQEEVRHVRDVEARLRRDLEEARQAATEGRAAMRREMQAVASDILSLRQDLRLLILRSESHLPPQPAAGSPAPAAPTARYSTGAAHPAVSESGGGNGLGDAELDDVLGLTQR